MRKLLMTLMLAVAFAANADAQGWLKKLKDKAVDKIKERVENKVEKEAGKAADDVLDGKSPEKSKESDDAEAGDEDADALTTTSSDFKRGEVILFQDDFSAETVGEFPSKWDLLDGSAEVKTHGGVKAVEITNNGVITPLIKEQGAYLPEEFTIEYEFYYWVKKENVGLNNLRLCLANNTDRSKWAGYYGETCAFSLEHGVVDEYSHHYNYNNGTGTDTKQTDFEYRFKKGWNKVALSFNKRAMKVYFNGKRVANLPRVQQATWLSFQVPYDYHDLTFIRNVVIAKGAVALYDRNEQSMSAVEKAIQKTGKFVTNNILFETGKATLKAESMEEIQKVADYMKKNPAVRFEVQGHTDNQGSDKVNDPLSQQRAEAVVKALEGLGVDGFNLRAVGKGAHEPVADNATDAGRAKNRRVEFIKK
ncbi:MAG: OmpA family protein [Prevotella sp.]|nr:OmpA family protein [Prevotella sp.]